MNVFGQRKGEKYVAPCLSASFGTTTYKYAYFNQEYKETEPNTLSVSPSIEYGRFVNDNVRLSIALGFPFDAYPNDSEYDDKWNFDKMFGFRLSPNMGIYVPITDRFCYAPEIGVGYEFGFYWSGGSYIEEYELYNRYLAYINVLSFEFRVKEKVAIMMYMGEMGYCFSKILGSRASTQQLYFSFNSGAISVRFYL